MLDLLIDEIKVDVLKEMFDCSHKIVKANKDQINNDVELLKDIGKNGKFLWCANGTGTTFIDLNRSEDGDLCKIKLWQLDQSAKFIYYHNGKFGWVTQDRALEIVIEHGENTRVENSKYQTTSAFMSVDEIDVVKYELYNRKWGRY